MVDDIDDIIAARVATEVDTKLAAALSGVLKGDPGDPGPPGSGSAFSGRLTLQSGSPVMTSDQTAKQQVFYSPIAGGDVPIVIGGELVAKPFLSSATDQVGLTLNLAGSAAWTAGSVHDVFAVWNGTQLVLATRQWDAAMFPTEELIAGGTTISAGGSWARPDAAFDGNPTQNYSTGARLYPSSAGVTNCLGKDWGSTGYAVSRVEITAASDNYLLNTGTAGALTKVWGSFDSTNWNMLGYFYTDCSVYGNVNSLPINISNRVPYTKVRVGIDGGPSYSINIAELKFLHEVAPATRRLGRYAGLLTNDASMTARLGSSETLTVPANEGMYLGTIRIDPDAPGRVTAHAEYGPSRMHNIWNAYNRRPIVLKAGVITPNVSSYGLSLTKWGPIQTSGFSLDVLVGLAEERVNASLGRSIFLNGLSAYECGIGVDNTMSFSGKFAGHNFDNSGTLSGNDLWARLTMPYFAGVRRLHGIERGNGTVSPAVDQRSTVLEASWLG